MPELPEVELMARLAQQVAGGRRLDAVEVCDPALLQGDPAGLPGQRLRRAWRRAKLCILELEEQALVLHFRMSGKLVVDRPGLGPRPATRLRLSFSEGVHLALVDPRRLAEARVLPLAELEARFTARGLGPEAWPERRSGPWWAERLGQGPGALKPALLRQDRVAGLGNILASELLWRARLDPRASLASLRAADWESLARAVPETIDEVLAAEAEGFAREGELRYVNQGGPNPFQVYGREGAPCRRCGAPILRALQAGRSSFWCADCQSSEQR